MMRKAKKNDKSAGWKTMISAAIIIIVGVVVYCGIREWIRINDELERINWNAGMAFHGSQADELYREAGVSDDGKWFLIPEVRIKFPYFWVENVEVNDIGEESRYWGMWPLRYAASAWRQDNGNEGFYVNLTFHAFSERWGEACVDPFRIAVHDPDRTNLTHGDEYEVVSELNLASSRAVKLMKRSGGASACSEFINSIAGQMVAENLSRMRSY